MATPQAQAEVPTTSAPTVSTLTEDVTQEKPSNNSALPTESTDSEKVTELTSPAAAAILQAFEQSATENDALVSTTHTTQPMPMPMPDPELGLKMAAAAAAKPAPVKRKTRRFPGTFKRVVWGIGGILLQGLSFLWIGLLYGIPGAIIIALGIAVLFGIPLAFAAAYGSVAMLMGNGILRAAHMAHYTSNASAAAIGATGTAISGPALGFVLNLLGFRFDEENPSPWYTRMIITVIAHTMSGAVGCAVLLKHHVDLGPIDVLHATRAGALGGALLGPGTIIAMPIIALALGIVFSPLWIVMMMGLKWCYVRSSETYEGSLHRYSSCVTYGTCYPDEEIEEEIAMAQTPKYALTGRNRFVSDF